jgi:hypothetical protein
MPTTCATASCRACGDGTRGRRKEFTVYDVIVVGARCAGSPTAMLLARKGYRVLLVDRATFPSDTPSTHFIRPSGVVQLKRWGLLERVIASGCPPISRFRLDWGLSGCRSPPVVRLPARTRGAGHRALAVIALTPRPRAAPAPASRGAMPDAASPGCSTARTHRAPTGDAARRG